jgi:hypothetical protein
MTALVVACEVRRGEGTIIPDCGIRRAFPDTKRPVALVRAAATSSGGAYPAPPASIYAVTDGDAAISRFSMSIPGHSWYRAGMTGVPYRGSRLCLTMASARNSPDKGFPGKANDEPGNFSPAVVLTFMAKGACS